MTTIRVRFDGKVLVPEGDVPSLPVGVPLTATVGPTVPSPDVVATMPEDDGKVLSDAAWEEQFLQRVAQARARGPGEPPPPLPDGRQPIRIGDGWGYPAAVGDGTAAGILAAIESGELQDPWEGRDIGDSVEFARALRERAQRPRYDREGNRIEYPD